MAATQPLEFTEVFAYISTLFLFLSEKVAQLWVSIVMCLVSRTSHDVLWEEDAPGWFFSHYSSELFKAHPLPNQPSPVALQTLPRAAPECALLSASVGLGTAQVSSFPARANCQLLPAVVRWRVNNKNSRTFTKPELFHWTFCWIMVKEGC